MTGSRLDFDSAAFDRALRDRIETLKRNAEREELRLAEATADRMRSMVPRDTGQTADSIDVRKADKGVEIVTGGASIFLEFGTSKMRPRPFARPALAEARSRFVPPSWH